MIYRFVYIKHLNWFGIVCFFTFSSFLWLRQPNLYIRALLAVSHMNSKYNEERNGFVKSQNSLVRTAVSFDVHEFIFRIRNHNTGNLEFMCIRNSTKLLILWHFSSFRRRFLKQRKHTQFPAVLFFSIPFRRNWFHNRNRFYQCAVFS